MKCPQCSARMLVSDARYRTDGATRRRYFCPLCGGKLTTIEKPVVEDAAPNPITNALMEIMRISSVAIAEQKEKT